MFSGNDATYEKDSLSQSVRALLSLLVHQRNNDNTRAKLSRPDNDTETAGMCQHTTLSDQDYQDTDEYLKLMVSRLQEDDLAHPWDFRLDAEQKEIESITK